MRIVITGQTYYPAANGQAVFSVHLAEGLARAGHAVMVIVPSERQQPYAVNLHDVRIQALRAVPLRPKYPDVYFAPLPGAQVGRLLDAHQPDIVHIQDHYPISQLALAEARKRGIPVMGTNHFLPENIVHYVPVPAWARRYVSRLLWVSVRRVFNRLQLATTPTATAARILRQHGIRIPIYPVSCGVRLDRFSPAPSIDRAAWRRRYGLDPERVVFLFVGRVDLEKRLDVLLRALKLLPREDVQLGIAGRGRYEQKLKELAEKLGLGDRVVFTGYIPAEDLPALLNSVDIFAMPSEAELQSIATLEAMATGRPILAADAQALPELVENGVNGYLFRAGSADDAARRMAQLIAERERWPAMGAASLQRAQAHSLANTIARYEELYAGLVRATQPAVNPAWSVAGG